MIRYLLIADTSIGTNCIRNDRDAGRMSLARTCNNSDFWDSNGGDVNMDVDVFPSKSTRYRTIIW